MKKLLVLNGSHSDIPLIKAGKELGYYVITTGNRPELIGHQYGDEYVYGDFSNVEEMYKIFRNYDLDGVCACANDFGAITASYLADKLGLPGHDSYETTLILHHKDKFKEFSKKYDIPTPLAESFLDVETTVKYGDTVDYPVMVKPIDLTGGKGVTRVCKKEDYRDAIEHAFSISKAKKIVVEPYIEGTQHSFSTFLVKGKVAAYFSDNEYSMDNPFLVSTSCGPATNVEYAEKILIDTAEKIADVLQLRDGVFHYQYIRDKNNFPHILEITRRCSGDLYNVPVEHATGIEWAKWIVKTELGYSCDDFPIGKKQTIMGGRHCIMGRRNGIVKDVYISPDIKENIYDEFMWWTPGYAIENYMVDKVGIVFLQFSDYDEMIEKTEHIDDYIKIIYEY
ncbi:MAG: acetyl-CoA carboxylase biotin carboxylase subunit family protein [Lachnospiraceae bacterium]